MAKSWAGAWEQGNEFSEILRVIKTRTLLHRFDEVGQLLHESGQLFYEVHLLTASGAWQAGTSSVGKYIKPLVFHP